MDCPATIQPAVAAKGKLNYGHLPFMFEPNQGTD